MKKMIKVEVCIISARGLKRPSSLWKPQWFAVGWIDPNNKYCTKIDTSGTTNPSWKTKFSAQIESIDDDYDDDGSGSHSETALHVQVYSREPIFLRERLQGTATVLLKEFLKKKRNSSSETPPSSNYHGPGSEEVGSFQLRKKNSGKPQGFVDVSIRVFYDRDGGHGGNSTSEGGIGLINFTSTNDGGNEMYRGGGGEENGWGSAAYSHPPSQSHQPLSDPNWQQQQNYRPPTAHQKPPNNNSNWQQQNYPPPIAHQMPPNNNSNWQQQQNYPPPIANQMPPNNNNSNQQPSSSSIGSGGPSYYHHPSTQPPPPPPPPPPPSHVGYLPSFFPRTDPFAAGTSSGAGGIARPGGAAGGNGFRMGAATGALAAGAVIFGDDFMSGFDVPSMSLQDEDPYSITITKTNPPF